MLHYETIEPGTLELLKNLMQVPEFGALSLVGGTSLALQIGHRKSIDLDLFGTLDAEPDEIKRLIATLGQLVTLKSSRNIHVFSVSGIKVDIVNYAYPWLSGAMQAEGLRLASMEDIAAMKLSAVMGRGTRKDFVDVGFLLNYYSLREMMDFYIAKYADGSPFLVLKSLIYFEDAEQEPDPYMLLPFDWAALKAKLNNEVARLI